MANSRRGFAGMTPEARREIASLGGKAAHAKGTAHEFTSEEAIAAGRKGGSVISANRVHMSEIGRKGGIARRKTVEAELPPPDAEQSGE